tara:strand:+ start:2134 stop:2577 length:444 start_codon:yes stop_codon:yes gene_type:complete
VNIISIYTDGACSGNPGSGGWGVVIISNGEISEFSGGEIDTTNNRMELKAAIEGIRKAPQCDSLKLFTDSKYVKDGITNWIMNWKENNWKTASKKNVKNQDLWKELDFLTTQHTINWQWVKAHQLTNDEHSVFNNIADELARNAIPS